MAKAAGRGGWQSLFVGKDGSRYQGVLTRQGSKDFELHRAFLARLHNRPKRKITDADVIEYLARGSDAATTYWETLGIRLNQDA